MCVKHVEVVENKGEVGIDDVVRVVHDKFHKLRIAMATKLENGKV